MFCSISLLQVHQSSCKERSFMKKITQKRKQDRSGSKPHYKKIANREYKSTIFCMLFREKEKLLSLYNAVNNTSNAYVPIFLKITLWKMLSYWQLTNVSAMAYFQISC